LKSGRWRVVKVRGKLPEVYVSDKPVRKVRICRLVWFRMTGMWPDAVRHLNGDRHDMRWSNLETVQSDRARTARKPHGRVPHMNIWWHAQRRRYCVQIKHRGVRRSHGAYPTIAEAVRARDEAYGRLGL